jgi:ribosomal protein S21
MATAGLAVDDAVRRLKRAATTAAAARAWRRRHRP